MYHCYVQFLAQLHPQSNLSLMCAIIEKVAMLHYVRLLIANRIELIQQVRGGGEGRGGGIDPVP